MELPSWLSSSKDSIKSNNDPYLQLIHQFGKYEDQLQEEIMITPIFRKGLSITSLNLLDKFTHNNKLMKEEFLISALKKGTELEKIVKYLSWQNFELLTSSILMRCEWETRTNFRFFGEGAVSRDRKRFEIDVISWKRPYVLLIDCKRHANSNSGSIKQSVEKQVERAFELFEMTPIIHDMPEMIWSKWETAIIVPIIITWKDNKLDFHGKVPICPSSKLIDFFSMFTLYFDSSEWFNLKWSGT